jgi:hypothetical protein
MLEDRGHGSKTQWNVLRAVLRWCLLKEKSSPHTAKPIALHCHYVCWNTSSFSMMRDRRDVPQQHAAMGEQQFEQSTTDRAAFSEASPFHLRRRRRDPRYMKPKQ